MEDLNLQLLVQLCLIVSQYGFQNSKCSLPKKERIKNVCSQGVIKKLRDCGIVSEIFDRTSYCKKLCLSHSFILVWLDSDDDDVRRLTCHHSFLNVSSDIPY